MGILKEEFPSEQDWFSKFKVLFDLGFVGVDKLYKLNLSNNYCLGEKQEF